MFAFLKSLLFSPPPSPEVVQHLTTQLESLISKSSILVASKSHCPYCVETKRTLASYGINLESVDPNTSDNTPNETTKKAVLLELNQLSEGGLIQNILLQFTGQSTVPNIYIAGKHIGGNSDLQALKSSGQLEPLLKSAGLI